MKLLGRLRTSHSHGLYETRRTETFKLIETTGGASWNCDRCKGAGLRHENGMFNGTFGLFESSAARSYDSQFSPSKAYRLTFPCHQSRLSLDLINCVENSGVPYSLCDPVCVSLRCLLPVSSYQKVGLKLDLFEEMKAGLPL